MKLMKTKFLFCSLLLCAASLKAQTEVSTFTPGVTIEGVNYFLPQTAIRLVVIAEKQVYQPGDFRNYAGLYLNLKDIPKDSYTKWTIKSISIDTYGVPDPQKAYNIKLQKRTVAPLVGLSSEGILLSINTEGSEEALPDLPKNTEPTKRFNPRDFMNRDMLSAGSNAKIAELVADEIYDIRDSRNALIRGEADNTPKDGTQLKLMLDNLQNQEDAFLQLFKGYTATSTEVFSVSLTPTTELDKMVLFRFSEKLGVLDNNDLAGEPVYISIKNLNTSPAPVEDEKATRKKHKMDKGIWYNVPGQAAIKVFNSKQTFCKGEYPFAQFGTSEILSDVLFDKNSTIKVTFYQSTGGIEQLTDGKTE